VRGWIAGAGSVLLVVAFLLILVHRGPAATPRDERDVTAGQALYARNCAPCHGPGAKGDGASAAAFATKPTDLTDGRLVNRLPDEFFTIVILDGGPAMGLAPTMPPFRGNLNEAQARQIVAYLRTLAQPAFHPASAKPLIAPSHAPVQPIYFNHVVHAGSFQIPCQYCHAGARRGVAAGLPSVQRCMGCHVIIGAQDNPEIRKIHDYWARREPIPWIRVFKVPEFTYFPHKPHVRAGVECQTCHGPIERMPRVGAERLGHWIPEDLLNLVRIRPVVRPLSMGWCIDCHRDQNARKGTDAPLDCVTCHH
jgi:mono/diheme cytochrome c family protein